MSQVFCPLGYTSLKKLWDQNRDAFSWEQMDLERFFQSIFELDDVATSTWMAKTLSTDELIEKVLFECAFEGGLLLSSPSGQVLQMDVKFFAANMFFHHVMNSIPEFFSEDFSHYEPTRIFPSRLSEIETLKSEGKDPWWELREKQGFCSVNYYYDRDTYCISLEVFRRLKTVSNGFISTELLRVQPQLISPLEGWAICVNDEAAQRLSPTKLFDRLRWELASEALQIDKGEFDTYHKKSAKTAGRPKISIDAAEAFLRHYSLEERPSWKEAVNKIRTEEGVDVSVRTLQRGLREIFDDKSRT